MRYILILALAAGGIAALKKRAKKENTLLLPDSRAFWGIALMTLGALAAAAPLGAVMDLAGALIAAGGALLLAWVLKFSLSYDEACFCLQGLKGARQYRYGQIAGQKLYLTQGGGVIIELHMEDGSAVSLQSDIPGVYAFLDRAFARWLAEKGIREADCPWYNPEQSCWFPEAEV